ncbi:hypothetical protein IC617_08680 [Neiella sp. HB171785]|uniref:Uncharacterized protein n=1 Tax=Neiella litorisoli TaxID=2771431 RepID=A0A8J6QJW3_9GAMM|nr:hypothetical protein [Neiella litorisoli]MBD1389501.1 hypothetical protein [Neiella litorisoli]
MRLTLVITEVNQRFGFKGSASYLGEVKHGPHSIVKLPHLCQTEECLIGLIESAVVTLDNVSLRIDKRIHGYQPKAGRVLVS